MRAEGWMDSGDVLVEFGLRRVRVRCGAREAEWVLERGNNGSLTPDCRARLVREVAAWLGRKPWQGKPKAWCLMPGSGVSLRRWKVPTTGSNGVEDLVRLQIEAEFPVPPEELAWGWVPLGNNGSGRELLVVATKRAMLDEHAAWLAEIGTAPVFGVASLAREGLLSGPSGGHVMIDIGSEQAEMLVVDEAGPVRLRTISLDEESMLRGMAERLGIEPRVLSAGLEGWEQGGTVTGVDAVALAAAAESAWDPVVPAIHAARRGGGVYLSASRRLAPVLVQGLQRRLGAAYSVEVLFRAVPGELSSAASGLAALRSREGASRFPEIRTPKVEPVSALSRKTPRRWAVLAGAALLAVLGLPYLEALLFQPGLAARVATVKSKQDRLRLIDREVDFLRHLKQNQSAHLDTLLVLGKSSPPGARIDSFSLNRKGELSLRISMRQPPEVVAFRNKLVDSGFFSSVVVEEQAPSPDRQKLMVRLSAQLRAAAEREGLKILSTNEPAGGGPNTRPPGMPPGMPMGVPMGMPMPPPG